VSTQIAMSSFLRLESNTRMDCVVILTEIMFCPSECAPLFNYPSRPEG
jgi:hypothetical protein